MKKLDWQTPAQAKWQADYLRDRMRNNRMIADRFETWRICARKPCRRRSACLGPDPIGCARHLVWDVLDETQRTTLQLSMQLRAGGASPQDAWREAERRIGERQGEALERSDGRGA